MKAQQNMQLVKALCSNSSLASGVVVLPRLLLFQTSKIQAGMLAVISVLSYTRGGGYCMLDMSPTCLAAAMLVQGSRFSGDGSPDAEQLPEPPISSKRVSNMRRLSGWAADIESYEKNLVRACEKSMGALRLNAQDALLNVKTNMGMPSVLPGSVKPPYGIGPLCNPSKLWNSTRTKPVHKQSPPSVVRRDHQPKPMAVWDRGVRSGLVTVVAVHGPRAGPAERAERCGGLPSVAVRSTRHHRHRCARVLARVNGPAWGEVSPAERRRVRVVGPVELLHFGGLRDAAGRIGRRAKLCPARAPPPRTSLDVERRGLG